MWGLTLDMGALCRKRPAMADTECLRNSRKKESGPNGHSGLVIVANERGPAMP